MIIILNKNSEYYMVERRPTVVIRQQTSELKTASVFSCRRFGN